MTPRGEVDWLDASAGEDAARAALTRTAHSRLPVGEGSPEAVIGVVQARELVAALLAGRPLDLRAAARRAPVVPDTADALDVLAILRAAEVPMALVHDEHGNFEGVVTPTDLTEAIVGALRSDAELGGEPAAVRREDGSWLLAGAMPADEMAELLGIAAGAATTRGRLCRAGRRGGGGAGLARRGGGPRRPADRQAARHSGARGGRARRGVLPIKPDTRQGWTTGQR